MIVLPGLVNTHHHLYQTLTRCIAQDSVLFDWLVTLYPIWARLTPEAVYVSAKVGLAELMLIRLHHLQRSPLRLPQRLQDRATRSRPRSSWASASPPRAAA